MIDLNKAIKRLILERKTTQTEVGALLNMSRMQFNGVISKKDLRIHSDIERIANALNYDVRLIFVDRENGKEIEVD